MANQNPDVWRESITQRFLELKKTNPEKIERRLSISWSNWTFGIENLDTSARRLAAVDIDFIELHGNHYGPNLGYSASETNMILKDYGLQVSGVCGMFGEDNDLSSNRPVHQQQAIAYINREIDFTQAVHGDYILIVPGAVGRPTPYDDAELIRSSDALRSVANRFVSTGIKAAIEPIRSDEVSLVHSVRDAVAYIKMVDHAGIQHINGDIFHMQAEEKNVPLAILEAGDRLVNLHLADSNRRALGAGSMDIDTIIMALYLIGHNTEGRYVTPEPLGPGATPYKARNAVHDPRDLDALVETSVNYFRAREEAVLAL